MTNEADISHSANRRFLHKTSNSSKPEQQRLQRASNCKCIYFATYLANWEVYVPHPGPLNITFAVGPSGIHEIL